jgi:hypothetical protein
MNWDQYISGFFDGDGSITIERSNGSYTLRIKFHQSNEQFIDILHKKYPFLHKHSQDRGKLRVEFCLRGAGRVIEPLLSQLLQHSILKYEQLCVATSFLQLQKPMKNEKHCAFLKMKQLKVFSSCKPYERITVHYIAGLFDAEESIGLYSSGLRVKLTQKSDLTILQEIAKIYNNTCKLSNYALCFYSSNCAHFLQDIQPYCIYKRPQIDVALSYINKTCLFNDASMLLKQLKKE